MTEEPFYPEQFFNDLAELPAAERREKMEDKERQITSELQAVNVELDIAKFKLRRGDDIDLGWLRKARIARNIKAKQVQLLQKEIRKIPRTRPPGLKYVSDFFVDVAREKLPIELFHEILMTAQAREKSSN